MVDEKSAAVAFALRSWRNGIAMQNDVLIIEYQQALRYNSDQQRWSEDLDISVRLGAEALTSGWLRDQFGGRGGPLEFITLMAITLHARPLIGAPLQDFIRLQIACAEDEGRMFSLISDAGLADELGLERHTVDAAAERLRDKGLIDIWPLPKQYRQQGRFSASKVYVLSGQTQRTFVKEITRRSESTEAHRGSLTTTVAAPPQPHRGSSSSNRGAGTTTNDVVDLVVVAEKEDETIFTHFAARKNEPTYAPTGRDRQALGELRRAGYAPEQIIAGIDAVFDRGDRPRRFAYCARVIQDQPPAQPAAPAATPALPTDPVTPAEWQPLVTLLQSAQRDITPDGLTRLRLIAERADEAARKYQTSGLAWLTEAIQRSIGRADDVLAYAEAIVTSWIEHGPQSDVRPRRTGYQPVAKGQPSALSGNGRPRRDFDAEVRGGTP